MNIHLRPIFSRRSIRKYTDQAVVPGMVRDLLEAAMAAPSAAAEDPWHFVVIRHPETLKKIADGLENGRHLAHAAVGIAVCGDTKLIEKGDLSYLLQDCSVATENILLAVSMLGLGASWCSLHPFKPRIDLVRKLAKLPKRIVPINVIAIGWPAQRAAPRTRFRARRVHYEKW